MRCWHGYLSGAWCRFAYGAADPTATHCLLLQIGFGFTFVVPAHLDSPGQTPESHKMVVIVVVICHCNMVPIADKYGVIQHLLFILNLETKSFTWNVF